MADIRLDDVHTAAREHVLKAPAGEIALACRDRGMASARKLEELILVFAEHRFFHKHEGCTAPAF